MMVSERIPILPTVNGDNVGYLFTKESPNDGAVPGLR
jgi:hypothetical protein